MAAGGSHLSKNSGGRSVRKTAAPRSSSAPKHSAPETVRSKATVTAPSASRGSARKTRRRRTGFPLWPVLVLLILALLFSGFMLVRTLVSYGKNRSVYDSLRDIAVVQLTPGPREVVTEDGRVETVQSEIPLSVDWDALRAVNPEIVAWLYCPDTIINYPVVRASDNEKYLSTNFEGEYNAGGTLFADYGSSAGFLNAHFIIYGHNMKDNSMFGTLKNYGDPKYFEQHPVFYLLTPDQAYRVDLLQAATIDATVENYPTYFGEGQTLESYVGRISRNVYWFNDQADWQNNQLLTMSTCTSSDAQRLILQGTMIPIE